MTIHLSFLRTALVYHLLFHYNLTVTPFPLKSVLVSTINYIWSLYQHPIDCCTLQSMLGRKLSVQYVFVKGNQPASCLVIILPLFIAYVISEANVS